jgi:hypothetical protein
MVLWACLAAGALAPRLAAAAVPTTMTFTARAEQNGVPLSGSHDLQFSLYSEGGTLLWGQSFPAVTIVDGYVDLVLGDASLPSVFDGQKVFLSVTLGGVTLEPMIELASVPYAMTAGTAHKLGPYAPTDLQEKLDAPCPAGRVLSGFAQDGTPTCVPQPAMATAGLSNGNPIGANDIVLSTLNVNLPAPGKIMVMATLGFYPTSGPTSLWVYCTIEVDDQPAVTATFLAHVFEEDTNTIAGVFPPGTLAAGAHKIELVCNAPGGVSVLPQTARLVAEFFTASL